MSGTIKSYHIITIGCQMNKSDSERIAGFLEENGWTLTKNRAEADCVIINTCGVRQSAEDRVYGLAPKIKRENPAGKLVITGCLSARQDVQAKLGNKVDIWLPIVNLPDLLKALEAGKSGCLDDYLTIRPKYTSGFKAFVPIGNGCDNFCTYCVVPYARGREKYRPVREVLAEVQDLADKGYKEIELIAQNVNSYRSDGSDFADLLKQVDAIPGDFWVRFATSHPKDMADKLIQTIAETDKVCRHIHLPAQSGDNETLRAMNRNYTREHYLQLTDKIRYYLPGASLTTDIIVGFPGETEARFQNTKRLFEQAEFDLAYIARYSPRPGTAAAKLKDDVDEETKKSREEELMAILRQTALSHNQKYLDQNARVLVEGRDKQGRAFGKTDTYKNVKILNSTAKSGLSGHFTDVKITQARDFGLEGDI